MSQLEFTCADCGKTFTLRPDILSRYPGWTPRQCPDCKYGQRNASSAGGAARARRAPAKQRPHRGARKPPPKPAAKAVEGQAEAPGDGVFTDGSCSGNPGPGGWAAVHVVGDEIVAERRGYDSHTTNNRMELTALINAYEMLPADAEVTIFSDSDLCVRTINEWAAGWQKLGWKRKKGKEIKNLELVQRAYDLALRHPQVKLAWIKAHDGSRWNEYADSRATAYLREEE